MSFDSANKKFVEPISIDDLHNYLATSSYDLATLCLASNITMYAIHKPISYPAAFPSGDYYKGNTGSDDYVNGVENYGIRKAYCDVTGRVITSNVVGTYSFACPSPSMTYHRPSGGPSSPYRIQDFLGYSPAPPSYPNGIKPIVNATIVPKFQSGLFCACSLTYNYDDTDNFIGLGSMFGNDTGNGLYVGIIVEAAMKNGTVTPPKGTTERSIPAGICYRGPKIDGSVNSSTGVNYQVTCSLPTIGMLDGYPTNTSTKYFYKREYLLCSFGLIKYGTSTQKFFPLAQTWFVASEGSDTTNYSEFNNITVLSRIIKNSDGTYWIYFSSNSDVAATLTGRTTAITTILSFSPADGNTVAKTMNVAVWNTGANPTSGAINLASTTWSSNSPFDKCAMKFTASSTSCKLAWSTTCKILGGKTRKFTATWTVTLPTMEADPIAPNRQICTISEY